jgi:hypothetical protein
MRTSDLTLLHGEQDHDNWLSATLSSLPSPRKVPNHANTSKNRSAEQSPKSQNTEIVMAKAESSQSIQRATSPPKQQAVQRSTSPPKQPAKMAAKKTLRIMDEVDSNDSKHTKEESYDKVLPRAKRNAKRSATQFGVKGGRSVDEVLARDKARVAVAQGFTESLNPQLSRCPMAPGHERTHSS